MVDQEITSRMPSRGDIPSHVVNGLPMPVVVTRLTDDTMVCVNPEFEAAYGYVGSEVSGLDFKRIHFVPEDRDAALAVFAAGRLESVEVRIRNAEGGCCWAQADVSRFDLNGSPVLLTTLYNIGGRKKAEREVAERSAVIEEMARFPEMNPGPVMRLDLDGIIGRANSAARESLGQDSLVGVAFLDMCDALDDDAWGQLLSKGGPLTCEEEFGGKQFSFTLAHERETDHVFVFGADISKLKSAEQELAERARFPAMNPGPVARTDRVGMVVRANPAASALFKVDSIQGESWLHLCPGMDDELWARIFSDGEYQVHEADFDDRCLSFTFRHEPISDQVFVYGTDVTELKVAERALAELARFPDMNPGPVLRLDRKGSVILANPAARRVFKDQDLTGRSWFELCPGVDESFWSKVCSRGETAVLEATLEGRQYVLTHARGPEGIFVFVYGSDVTDQKNTEIALRQSEKMATLGTLAAGVAHELNNPAAASQRAAEQLDATFEALQRSEATLRALTLSGDGATVLQELDGRAREVAHCPCDLDPLARSDKQEEIEAWLDRNGAEDPWELAPGLVELGYETEALDALAGRVGVEAAVVLLAWQTRAHEVYRLLGEIRHGSSRLVEIVGAMKSYAYLGKAPLQNVDVNEGVRNTLVILRNKLKTGISVRQELDPSLPRIQAYGSDLNQVWTNLLDNAADAMGGKGSIVVRSALREDRVAVEIEDDGPGIPPEIQSRVFDAFFTTKPPGKGTGLGLNTSYKIVVQKHGGDIRVESEPGATRFVVELPLVPPAPTEEDDAPSTFAEENQGDL